MATRSLHGIEIFEQLEKDHPSIISAKIAEIPPSSLGGDNGLRTMWKDIGLTERRQTSYDHDY